MSTILLPPVSDAGPNQGTVVSGPHYPLVDEEPHDGDASIVEFFSPDLKEAFDLDASGIAADAVIQSVTVKWAAKFIGSLTSRSRAGLRIAGVEYFSAFKLMTTGYLSFTEVFSTDPSDGAVWTKARVAAAQLITHVGPGTFAVDSEVVLTNLVGLADVLPPPDRPTATDIAVVPSASGSAQSTPTGIAAPVVGTVVMVGIAPDGSPIVIAGSASGQPVAAAGTCAAVVGSAPMSDPGKPSATPASMDPAATPASMNPSATAAVVTPPSGQGA